MLLSLYDVIFTESGQLTPYGLFWRFCIGPDILGTSDTGGAWNNPEDFRPRALFDQDARRIIPLDWSAWLQSIGSTYASHVMLPSPELDFQDVLVKDGVIVVRVFRKAGAVLKLNKDYAVTCRITAANSEVQDKTLYLRMANF